MKWKTVVLIAAFFVTLACVAQASAQSPRTFVAVGGSDANDCSFATPCRTFAGAVPNTAPGGEIPALDSGGYGAVTINNALTLQAAPGAHVELGDGTATSAMAINAGASDVIVLRNLHISRSGSTQRGIEFNSGGPGGALFIESCVVTGFSNGYGIRTSGCNNSGACRHLFIKDTILRENYYGIFLQSASAMIDRSWIENNTIGLTTSVYGGATIRDSVLAGNSDTGLSVPTGSIRLEDCLVTRNGTGISSSSSIPGMPGGVRVSNTTIVRNVTGLNPSIGPQEGDIISFGNNRLAANTTNGAFTSTLPQQ